VPTVEDWSEKDCKVVVRTTPGSNLLADLVLRAKVGKGGWGFCGTLTAPACCTSCRSWFQNIYAQQRTCRWVRFQCMRCSASRCRMELAVPES
jgi:hypothetical protein